MSDKLKGLFGGGMADDNDDGRTKLTDFAQRYTTGDPAEGYSDEEARENFQRILQTAPPDVIQRAAHATYENLPENRRSELNQMLQDRQQGKNLVDIQRTDQQGGGSQGGGDPLSDLFGGMMGGSGGGGLGDILGGFLGGGGASGGSSGGGGGLGDILGGLLGGGDDQETTRQPSPNTNTGATTSGGGIGDMLGGLLSGPMGKVIMGGIAAYAAKELMGQGR